LLASLWEATTSASSAGECRRRRDIGRRRTLAWRHSGWAGLGVHAATASLEHVVVVDYPGEQIESDGCQDLEQMLL
jgi:hypothetical protein